MKSAVILLIIYSRLSFAGVCGLEMEKFSLSIETKKQVCDFFRDEPSFKEFRDCVISTVKKFKRSATDEEIYKMSEKDLKGILHLCSGGAVGGGSAIPTTQPKKQPATTDR